ncbi:MULTISPECIES: VWA domain-containing protein [Streptomyces]|uniref:VWA domain-containing protein n=1 Tax=Streptomyces TaxID=1883 RepID=UPI0029C9CA10|nr:MULTISPECIES: VWA domain-containing protein [Streptomyces]
MNGGHTGVVVADRFDLVAWRDTLAQSAGLRALAEELGAEPGGAGGVVDFADLLADAFLAAYKANPRLREPGEMAPSRLGQHRAVGALVTTPGFAELRRETAGDPYAAAMAVLAQAPALRRMLARPPKAPEPDRPRPASAAAARAAEPAEPAAPAQPAEPASSAAEPGAAPEPGAAALRVAAREAAARAVEAVRAESTLMRAWGVGPGELARMSFERRARLAERLRAGRLAPWAELIGRFRRMASGEAARRVAGDAGELVGVTLGDDLTRVIPSELANLGLPELRAVFAARYAAGELMLYEGLAERATGRGAIVACVDTSHSMYEAGPGGVTREAWAKACALALLDQARRSRRDFVGVLFSSADRLRVFRFPARRPAAIGDVLDFAETFLGGGTSYQAPLSAAGALLAEEFEDAGRARGDIVLLTDDECGVTDEWLRGWREDKRRLGFRLFGVAVGAPSDAAGEGSVLAALCDNLRSVGDLTDVRAAADLFRVI